MHAVMVVFSDKVFTSVQKLHRLSFTSKMQHNCLVYFLEIVFPYGRGKASLDVYLKELSVHSRMSDLICHRRETHAHSLKKSLQICRLSSHILRAGVRFLAASLPFDPLFRHCKVDLTEAHSALHSDRASAQKDLSITKLF